MGNGVWLYGNSVPSLQFYVNLKFYKAKNETLLYEAFK